MDVNPVFGVLVVFALLGSTLALFRRFGWAVGRFPRLREKAQFLRVVASLRLEPGKALYAVQVNGRILLVATCPSGCSVITSFDPPAACGEVAVEGDVE